MNVTNTQPNMSFRIDTDEIDRVIGEFPDVPDEFKQKIRDWLGQVHPGTEVYEDITIDRGSLALNIARDRLARAYRDYLVATSDHPLATIVGQMMDQVISDAVYNDIATELREYFVQALDQLGRTRLSEFQLDDLTRIATAGFNDLLSPDYIDDRVLAFIQPIIGTSYSSAEEYTTTWNKLVSDGASIGLLDLLDTVVVSEELEGELKRFVEETLGKSNFAIMPDYAIIQTVEELRETIRETIRGYATQARVARKQVVIPKLTDAEIDSILSEIRFPGSYHGLTDLLERRIHKGLEEQLRSIRIEKQLIGTLRSKLKQRFINALVDSNHPVGMIAAQSIGEVSTQAGLRSFHHAGITVDSGYPRMKAVLELTNKPKTMFTYVGLKGDPSLKDARIFASYIAETKVGDVATFEVGHTREPEDFVDVMGGSMLFDEKPWMPLFVQLHSTDASRRGSFERPMWIIRMTFNVDLLFQRRIAIHEVAEAIEEYAINPVRVIYGPLSSNPNVPTIADIYYTGVVEAKVAGDDDETAMATFLHKYVEMISEIKIKGVPSFGNTTIESESISRFIEDVKFDPRDRSEKPRILIEFSPDDTQIRGIKADKIKRFLAMKADVEPEDIEQVNDHTYAYQPGEDSVICSPGALLNFRILNPETFTLASLEQEVTEYQDRLEVTLNRREAIITHEMDPVIMSDFFDSQNDIEQFASVYISFDRPTFRLTITPNVDFTGDVIWQELLQGDRLRTKMNEEVLTEAQLTAHTPLNSEDVSRYLQLVHSVPPDLFRDTKVRTDKQTIAVDGVNADIDMPMLKRWVRSFKDSIEMTVKNRGDTLDILMMLKPLTLQQAWLLIKGIETPVEFTSRRRERVGTIIRVVAGGGRYATDANIRNSEWGMNDLVMLPFVDPTTTIPSNPHEIFYILGVESTRSYVYSELKSNSENIADRHLALLADEVTYIGVLSKLDKSSGSLVNVTHDSLMSQAAGKQVFANFASGAAAGEIDNLRGTIAQTVVGRFTEPAIAEAESRKRDEQLTDSAISSLMSNTVRIATRTTKRRPVKAITIKPADVIAINDVLNDDDLDDRTDDSF